MSQTKAVVETIKIPLDQIKPSPYQPRLTFDLEDIRESIQRDGILISLAVRKKDGYYELIDGERRLRLAKELGYKTVPCDVIDIDDVMARRMIYKVNKARKDYTPEEEATFFKKLVEKEGMKPYQIETDLGADHQWVQACLNVWRFPKDIRDNIFGLTRGSKAFKVYMTDIRDLEPIINRNIDEAIAIVREIIDKRMTTDEKRELIRRREKKIAEETVEKATKAIENIAPEVKAPETPEEFEEAAKALKKRAKELKTPEQILEEKREKARNALVKGKISLLFWIEQAKKMRIDTTEFEKRIERIKAKIVNDPDEAIKETKQLKADVDKAIKNFEEKERKHRIEEEAEKRAKELEDAERRRIEEEAKAKAREELLSDTRFVRDFIEKEYPLMREVLGIEDLKRQLMQKLLANVPEEKMERAKEIFEEEIKSLQKRIEIFPEKSAKIEPKFEYLKLMEERGVIPYTIWDFQYRDDYAGDKDFHGNCSPQVVEQCIWRFTNERDLVLDPMAGSGTTMDVCKRYNRKCVGYDVKPPSNRTDIIRNDSRKIPLDNESIDMIFIHPPYWNLTYFTKAEEGLPDLSRAKTPEEFLHMLKQVFQECYRTLKRGKFMCVLLGDLIRDGRFIPLCREATSVAEEIGFIDYGYAIKLAHGEVSRKKSGVIIAEPIYTKNLKISHDLVMFFRKPELHGN